jgi:hypothetical protein
MMDKILGSLKSKTAWFAVLLVVAGALQQNMEVVTAAIGEGNVGWFTSFVGVVVYVLRLVTTKPVDEK